MLRKYMRFILGLRKFADARMEPEQALALARRSLAQRIAAREDNFLRFVQRGVFQYQKSPYLPLLNHVHIQWNDLKRWVDRDGIEATLLTLQREGVYFTVDEFKGRVPVQRPGFTFQCSEKMFDNPFLAFAYEVSSGATRSAGTRIRIDFDYLHQRSLYDAFLLAAHGCLDAPVANWFPIFPGAPGINSSLRFAHIGNPVRRWFSQVAEDQIRVKLDKRVGTKTLFVVHKMSGVPLAEPEFVDLNNARRVADWAAQMLSEHQHCVVYTFAASAVRVCIAAAEANLSLKGAKFLVTGEPLTPHKKKEIESTGASVVPIYGISEAGVIATGCPVDYPASDHCHVYNDTTAIISHNQAVPHFGTNVNAYLFTTLLHESPKLLLNVGMGDYGALWTDACPCPYGDLGFNTHIGHIRSYEKLTGEGVSFVDTDFVQIIERDLPQTFGGQSTDYQLIEEEDTDGITRLHLLINPRLGHIDEDQVLHKFLLLLAHGKHSDVGWEQSGVEMWRQSGAVRVLRANPIATASGKILPFHLRKPHVGSASSTKA